MARQLGLPLVPVVAVATFCPGDALHRRLRGYKDAPVGERRVDCAARLAAMFESWLTGPIPSRVAGPDRWDLVVTVPSSHRPGGDPVAAVVGAVPNLSRRLCPVLVRGPESTAHLRAARRGFVVRPGIDARSLAGRRVAVVDDCVVTGARAQSAAAALRLVGAEVAGIVALGRLRSTRPSAGG